MFYDFPISCGLDAYATWDVPLESTTYQDQILTNQIVQKAVP